MTEADTITRLCAWYARQSTDEWHEEFGVRIDTLDNPGWSVFVDLTRTDLERRTFSDVSTRRSDDDWVVARRRGLVLELFGGPANLDEMLRLFLAWAETRDTTGTSAT